MKICVLTYDLDAQSGGGGRYGAGLVSGLRSRGVEVVVLQEKPFPSGVAILKRGLGMIGSAIRAYPYLRQCDLVHALDLYPFGIIAWLANLVAHKPFVLTALGTYSVAPLRNWHTRFFARAACRSADAVIAISRYTEQRVREWVPLARIAVVPPGINLAHYPAPKERHAIPRQIISVGGLKTRKGYHISLQALALARRTIPDLTYVIVGEQRDRTYMNYLTQLCRDLNIEDAVSFRQNVSDEELIRMYDDAGLFLLTAVNDGDHFEGFGLVFLEAAAAGLPVIGTTDNGIVDAVAHGRNGLLVPQGDVKRTADAIVRILSDRALWQRMSGESRKWAKEHDFSDVTQQYLDVYRVLGNHSS